MVALKSTVLFYIAGLAAVTVHAAPRALQSRAGVSTNTISMKLKLIKIFLEHSLIGLGLHSRNKVFPIRRRLFSVSYSELMQPSHDFY